MFQYLWYDKKKFKKDIINLFGCHEKCISFNDIDKVHPTYWSEHCTECAVPQCYNNCENWEERIDKKCRRFTYGICRNKRFFFFLYTAQLEFKKWSKLRTFISFASIKPQTAIWLDVLSYYLSQNLLNVSKLLKYLLPTYKLNGAFEYFLNKMICKIGKKKSILDKFVFTVYSNLNFSLFFEILSNDDVIFRERIGIKPGINQTIINLNIQMEVNKQYAAEITAENSSNVEFIILMADFVSIKNESDIINTGDPAPKVKCVVWDLDNTIWDGILIESDAEKLELYPNVKEVMQALDERGIIQVVVSKNNENEAIPVLKRLGIFDYFIAFAINWNPKSENILNLAKNINIGVDAFALIDDSIFEHKEVSASLPNIRLYKETEIPAFLEYEPFCVPITVDSKNRRTMYQTETRRNVDMLSMQNVDKIEFLRLCDIKITIFNKIDDEMRNRSYELIQRTNQLNLSGNKYSKEEFYEFLKAHDNDAYVVFCDDRYGSYGQVVFFIVEKQEEYLHIIEFAMSCRVVKKCIESALIYFLMLHYPQISFICFDGINTQKNHLLINCIKDMGFDDISPSEQVIKLVINTKTLPFNYNVVAINKNFIL